MMTRRPSEPLGLHHILAILRRRWWWMVLCALIAGSVAFALSSMEDPVYRSSSEVLLSNQNLAGSLTGTLDSSPSNNPERIAETQAKLARVPEVARRTIDAAGIDRTVGDLLDSSSVTTSIDADLLTFSVEDGDRAAARVLVTEYARQFMGYRLRLDTAAIERARRELQARIREVRRRAGPQSALLDSLIEKDQTLQTLRSLQTSNVLLVRPGEEARQVSPQPMRNALLGLGLGLILGIGFAFLREALDTRVRSAEEISERLGLTLLARLPEPPRRLRGGDRLVVVAEPSGAHAEAFRMLRTNLEFVNLEHHARAIAVTSAIDGEGKSTTAANLAVALARQGKRVIVVDLDLRRPAIHRFFGLADRPGVTEVVQDESSIEQALASIVLVAAGPPPGSATAHANGAGERPLALRVMPSGALPRDAGELAGHAALGPLLSELRQQCDLVIVDTPPMLRVGDTMALSVHVDALIVVARAKALSRPMLAEMDRLLRRARATTLGVVVTGAEAGDEYGGAYYEYGQPSSQGALSRSEPT